MQKIDMSVIVTVYNIENYIADCIESILKEDRISIELILVDDTSYDRSYDILWIMLVGMKELRLFETKLIGELHLQEMWD